MPNEKQYRHRYGILNPELPDENSYTGDNPSLESGLDRLHKAIKPQSARKTERTTFVGHVVGVINNLGIEDLSAAQRAEVMGNPKKIKSFVVRIPESYSAAIPECVNVGSKKKKLDDVYSLLEKEVTFILLDPDLPSPGLGDLVRCDYLVRNEPSQGGVITEVLGKQGSRSKNILADKSGTTASEAHDAEGQSAVSANNEQNQLNASMKKEINELINPLLVALELKNKELPTTREGYRVNNFIEAIMFDIQSRLKEYFKGKEESMMGYLYILELYNPKKGGTLPLSYYADCVWANPSDLASGKSDFVKKTEAAGVVYGLVRDYDFDSISSKGTLQGGDIVNIWSKNSGRWINSTAVVVAPAPGDRKYTLVGPEGWTSGQNTGNDVITTYDAKIENTEENRFWVCRIRGDYERK